MMGGAANVTSTHNSQKELEFIESIIKSYIMEIKEKEKLNENNFNYNI